jgi:glycosyltransferase involved in cell wall biosynthesis
LPPARPTILQIIPELETGGAELSTVDMAAAIVDAGGRALVLSEGGRMAPRVADVGAEFIPFPAATKNPLRMLWNARQIARIIRENDVDLVHARSRAPAWSARKAARQCGVAYVTTYHGAYNEKNRIKNFYNSVMASGDVVIANSKYTSQLIQDRYGTPENRIYIVYRGLDGQRFDPDAIDEQRRQALRDNWRINDDTRIILQTARLTSWKGQRVVIDAAQRLQQQGALNNAVFILAGDAQGRTDYVKGLKRQISEAGLQDHVRLVGHVDDVPAALALAHIAVVASIEPEAFGRAATEAQAMRCPVIATNIGAPPETVLTQSKTGPEGWTGWLVPPNDAGALAGALAEGLILEEEQRRRLGDRARRHALTNFSLEQMRQQTVAAYDSLLGTQLAARLSN